MARKICQHHKHGYCYFKNHCHHRHLEEICDLYINGECEIKNCGKRHPKLCRDYLRWGYCKFLTKCMYRHVNFRDESVKQLKKVSEDLTLKLQHQENEIQHLKLQIETLNKLNKNMTNTNQPAHQIARVECDVCGKSFSHSRYVTRHKNSKHKPPSVLTDNAISSKQEPLSSSDKIEFLPDLTEEETKNANIALKNAGVNTEILSQKTKDFLMKKGKTHQSDAEETTFKPLDSEHVFAKNVSEEALALFESKISRELRKNEEKALPDHESWRALVALAVQESRQVDKFINMERELAENSSPLEWSIEDISSDSEG